jgi:putative peptidoglycan lipid II flippase
MTIMLIIFANPLVTLYHVGAFTQEAIAQIANYLVVLAIALPFYGVNTYLQMVFSAIRRMNVFSIITLIGSLAQVAIIAAAVAGLNAGAPTRIEWIAAATIAAYLIGDVIAFIYLAKKYSSNKAPHTQAPYKVDASRTSLASEILHPTLLACARGLTLGLAGGVLSWACLTIATTFIAPINGSLVLALIYTLICGGLGCALTFGLAIKFNLPEAAFITNITNKIVRKLHK